MSSMRVARLMKCFKNAKRSTDKDDRDLQCSLNNEVAVTSNDETLLFGVV